MKRYLMPRNVQTPLLKPTLVGRSAANFAFLAADGQVSHSESLRLADFRLAAFAPLSRDNYISNELMAFACSWR